MTFRLAGSGWMVGAACALVLMGACTTPLGSFEKAPAVAATSTSGTGGAASSGVGGVGGATSSVTMGAGGMGSATSSVATGSGGMGGGGMPPMLSFAAAASYGVGMFPYSVTAGDWNGDGKPDLAVANNSSDNVSILLNTSQ